MSRRYVLLAAVTVTAAIALGALGRPRRAAPPAPRTVEAPASTLALVIEAGRVSPAATSVAKGSRVRLRVENRAGRTVTLVLAGYEDRLGIPPLPPGMVWSGEFLADRPGDDLAWLLDGEPAGRLVIAGSHLIEGHR